MTFAEKIRSLRKKKGLTQQEIADELNISLRAWIYYEGGYRFPPQELLLQLANYFDVSTDYLVRNEVKDPRGKVRQLAPKELLAQVGSLLAGGSLDEKDRAKFLQALGDIARESADRAKRG